VPELMSAIKGPDFPTAGFIHGLEGIRQAYLTGRGIVQMRARATIEEMKGDRECIIITEIPYQVNKRRLLERIAELVQEKKITASAKSATSQTGRACASSPSSGRAKSRTSS